MKVLKNPNVKWLFGGIGAAVVGGYIVWRITGGEKPAPPQQITTPLYMPGSGGFAGGGGGGGVAPLDDIDIGDPMAMMAIQAEIERERIASQERMFMAGLMQSEKQESPLFVPVSPQAVADHSPTTTQAVQLATKQQLAEIDKKVLKSGGTTAGLSNAKPSQAVIDWNLQQANKPGGTSVDQRLRNMASTGDWEGLYTLAKAFGATSQQVAQATGLNYNEVVAWQQQQNLTVL